MDDVPKQASDRVFQYPPAVQRRHGPKGYLDYRSYKPWLRDEYSFRCVYCLWRERWEPDGQHGFGIDHLEPTSSAPDLETEYDNLVYACNACNSTRRDLPLPVDVATEALSRHMHALPNGELRVLSDLGETFIAVFRLNRPLLVSARRRILDLLAVLQAVQRPEAERLVRDLLAFPAVLPDLSSLRPPGGNTRPGGISDCLCERHRRGDLPVAY